MSSSSVATPARSFLPGDVPLDDPDVRSEFFKQIGEREKWDSVLDANVATDRARARRVDRRIGEASPALLQARVGTATATAVTLYSFGTRKDDLRGVDRVELMHACLKPGVEAPTIDSALSELREALLYMHVAGGRYRLDTIPSLTKLVEEATASVNGESLAKRIRDGIAAAIGNAPTAIVWPDGPAAIPDGRREHIFAYLPLDLAESPGRKGRVGVSGATHQDG